MILRHQIEGLPITLSDQGGGDVRWIHALTSKDFDYGGITYRLSDPTFFDAIAASLSEQIEGAAGRAFVHRPSFIVQHRKDGQGGLPAVNLGKCVAVRKVSRADLIAQGKAVPGDAENHIFVGVQLNRLGRSLDAEDQLPHASAGLEFGYDDHTRKDGEARVWPAWLHELSTATVPHIKELLDADDTRGLQLSDETTTTPEGTMTAAELKAALANLSPEERKQLLSDLQMGDGAPGQDDKDMPPAGGPPGSGLTMSDGGSTALELAELRATVKTQEKALASLQRDQARASVIQLCDAEGVIVRDADGKLDEETVTDLLTLKLADEERFQRMFKRLPRDQRQPGTREAKQGEPKGRLSLAEANSESRKELHRQALQLQEQDKTLSYTAALKRVKSTESAAE